MTAPRSGASVPAACRPRRSLDDPDSITGRRPPGPVPSRSDLSAGGASTYSPTMKRLLMGAPSIYLLFALIGHFVEGMGAVRCGCRPECWCKKPGLSTFRWVFPAGHSFGDGCA